MQTIKCVLSILATILLVSGTSKAQNPIIYPAQGQSQEQMDKDKYECYNWAKENSGFDPMQAQQPTPSPSQPPRRGGAIRGSVGGAVVGATVGAITRDPRRGAHIGAATGAVVGAGRQAELNARDQQAEQQRNEQQAESYTRSLDGYNRANSACMEGRGYTVK